jgi:hypothetical protein
MELLATVHWVAMREGAFSFAEAVEKIYAWNARKRTLDREQLQLAWRVLNTQGWLSRAG